MATEVLIRVSAFLGVLSLTASWEVLCSGKPEENRRRILWRCVTCGVILNSLGVTETFVEVSMRIRATI